MRGMNTISISKQRIQKEKGFVVLPIKEYQALVQRSVPEYFLTGKAALRLDKRVREGEKEYKAGKTISADSISSALAQYRKRHVR